MKVFILLWIGLFSVCYANAQQVITGQVADQSGRPIPFANVLILAATDSALVTGGVTDESGSFRLEAGPSAGLLKVSFIGFEDKYLPLTLGQANLGKITLREATEALAEIVVKGDRPVTRLKGDALVTTVENTLLSKVGSANDVLERIPGIIKKQEEYEVLGKGTPLIYINGRQVRDLSELEQLGADEIRNVELVTNPGARYDATVNAVVRIRTVRRQGEGFGLNLRSSYYQSKNTDLVEQVDLNYRYRGLDLSGSLNYDRTRSYMDAQVRQQNEAGDLWIQENQNWTDSGYDRLRATFSLNYLINEHHSVGAKYDLTAYPYKESTSRTVSDVTLNLVRYDHWESEGKNIDDYQPTSRLNAYYEGKIGNLSIDLNADYYHGRYETRSTTHEYSQEQDDRDILSLNPVRSQLAATKLTLSLPLGRGHLDWGGEYTHTSRTDDYLSESASYIPTSLSEIKEDNLSLFAEYGQSLPFGQFSAGLRYEHVAFDYFANRQPVPEQSRKFDNLFPNLSVAASIGPVQAQLSYAIKTKRPDYFYLSNNTTYLNRFTLKKGNPTLRHELTHDLTLASAWRFLQLAVSFQQKRHMIMTWGMPQEDHPEVTVIQPINFDKLPQLSAFLSAAPKIGIWSPTWSIGVMKQWLDIQSQGNRYVLSQPVWNGMFDNTFTLPWGLLFSVNISYTSKGHMANFYNARHLWVCDVSLRKSFLNDALSLELRGKDLFNRNWNNSVCYFDRMIGWELDKYDSREFVLTLRYKFNATKSRYKGTGAGKDAINRL